MAETADWLFTQIDAERRVKGAPLYAVLQQLAQEDEGSRLSSLRDHEESGFDGPERSQKSYKQDDRTRQLLDAALDALALQELAYATGLFSPAAVQLPAFDVLDTLLQSEAFCRYLAIYQYVSVRFLAGRLREKAAARGARPVYGLADPRKPEVSQENAPENRALCCLVSPPPIDRPDPVGVEQALQQMQALEDDCVAAPGVAEMKKFLDGYLTQARTPQEEAKRFELWLRDLSPHTQKAQENFERVVEGMLNWAKTFHDLVYRLEVTWTNEPRPPEPKAFERRNRREDEILKLTSPYITRFALVELYWLAKLLRLEIDRSGKVSGREISWLQLLADRADRHEQISEAYKLRGYDELLRLALGRTCDLVQNGAELTLESEDKRLGVVPAERGRTVQFSWRMVLDQEAHAIQEQRRARRNQPPSGDGSVPEAFVEPYWRERHRNGFLVRRQVGLSLSGGGIRSATFGLGVLQGLQELELLNRVDYLSTVSGGGYIGSWLVGNVKRTQHWLARRNGWDESIRHLRTYANYLMPRSGMLSGDTWSLGALWLRNTLLIQLMTFALILAGMCGIVLLRIAYGNATAALDADGNSWTWPAGVTYVCAALVTAFLCIQFTWNRLFKTRTVLLAGVATAWIGAALMGSYLQSLATGDLIRHKQAVAQAATAPVRPPASAVRIAGEQHASPAVGTESRITNNFDNSDAPRAPGWSVSWNFSHLLKDSFGDRWLCLWLWSFGGLTLVSASTLGRSAWDRRQQTADESAIRTTLEVIFGSIGIGAVSATVALLCLVGLLYELVHEFTVGSVHAPLAGFVLLPAAVLLAYCLGVLLLIGLSGRASNEPQREWWTRYAAWVLLAAGTGLLLCAIMFGGPWLIQFAGSRLAKHHAIKYGAIVSWLSTIVAGVFSGKSSRTAGNNPDKSTWMEILANVGGLLFVLTTLLLAAEVVYAFLHVSIDNPTLQDVGASVLAFPTKVAWAMFGVLVIAILLFAWRFEINIFGLNQLYRNRLVRCYLGATRWMHGLRRPQPFTKFDFEDDIPLGNLAKDFRGPYPLLNTTMNLGGSANPALNTRHSTNFILSPLFCGADWAGIGYAKTGAGNDTNCYAGGLNLGQAVAISGAAASPNMGYNTRPLVAYLLTMFNVRLGWWLPSPSFKAGRSSLSFSLAYLLAELFGMANDRRAFLNVSDGGHFENLGIYELVRRRCRVIIASDAECDETLFFGSLGNVIRLCGTDFGATIDIDLSALRKGEDGLSRLHCAVGTIQYNDGTTGYLIYLKANITGDEDTSVLQYRDNHPTFPHQTTANQFYTEDQFESYRRLGRHSVQSAFRGVPAQTKPLAAALILADRLVASSVAPETFVKYTQRLDGLWERFRNAAAAEAFFQQLMDGSPVVDATVSTLEVTLGLELLQLMEDVFLELKLEQLWDHPDTRGWAMLFMDWARSPKLQTIWNQYRRAYGIRFERFCDDKLGLTRETPIARVRPLQQRA